MCKAPKLVIARALRARGNLAVPGWIVGQLSAKTQLPSRDCHVGLRPPRNDKSLAFTIFMIACFLRRCSAGPGCPLPYNAQPLAVPSPAAPRRCPVQLPIFCTSSFKIFPPLSPDLAHCAAHPSSGGRTPEFVQIREKKEKFYANFC